MLSALAGFLKRWKGSVALPLSTASDSGASRANAEIEGRPPTALPRERRSILEIDACARINEVEVVERNVHLAEGLVDQVDLRRDVLVDQVEVHGSRHDFLVEREIPLVHL